jgi:hypothetical protein
MRYLAWIAVLSLQLGMFVCGAGIDVCHAADEPAHAAIGGPAAALTPVALTSIAQHVSAEPASPADNPVDQSGSPIDQTCSAHAAHVFLGQLHDQPNGPDIHRGQAALLSALNLPEILNRIEQPPQTVAQLIA